MEKKNKCSLCDRFGIKDYPYSKIWHCHVCGRVFCENCARFLNYECRCSGADLEKLYKNSLEE